MRRKSEKSGELRRKVKKKKQKAGGIGGRN